MASGDEAIAVMFTTHLYRQRRRGGFHWICDGLRRRGWRVRFVTTDFSALSLLNGDRRVSEGAWPVPRPLGQAKEERLETAVLATLLHPVGGDTSPAMRALNAVTAFYPGIARLRLKGMTQGAKLIVFESNASLFFAPYVRRISDAHLVYRVSDNLETIRPVPALLEAERRAAACVDVVSLASEDLARRFRPISKVRIDPMGIDKELFSRRYADPYPDDGRVRVVCTGTSGLDADSFNIAAAARPDWRFYLFGATTGSVSGSNVQMMGETPFHDLAPYVQHADIGFAPYRARPGVAYQADHSNRIIQYTYCRLPTVLPDVLCAPSRDHFFGYVAGDPASIAAALDGARLLDRSRVPSEGVWSWDDLAGVIAAGAIGGAAGDRR